MNVWAISDLHLSFARPQRRERYAARWRDHAAKIAEQWRMVVAPQDLVLIPGDLSMALNHRDLQPDLAWLEQLPGIKILSPGNHDRWWNRLDAVTPLLRETIRAVEGTAERVGHAVVCGWRGSARLAANPTPQARAELAAQDAQLIQALDQARKLGGGLDRPLYVLTHYPPFDNQNPAGPALDRLAAAKAKACVYGHLHIEGQWSRSPQGIIQGVLFRCVAADAIGFRPLAIDRLLESNPNPNPLPHTPTTNPNHRSHQSAPSASHFYNPPRAKGDNLLIFCSLTD